VFGVYGSLTLCIGHHIWVPSKSTSLARCTKSCSTDAMRHIGNRRARSIQNMSKSDRIIMKYCGHQFGWKNFAFSPLSPSYHSAGYRYHAVHMKIGALLPARVNIAHVQNELNSTRCDHSYTVTQYLLTTIYASNRLVEIRVNQMWKFFHAAKQRHGCVKRLNSKEKSPRARSPWSRFGLFVMQAAKKSYLGKNEFWIFLLPLFIELRCFNLLTYISAHVT
jgi:hypothetical protein